MPPGESADAGKRRLVIAACVIALSAPQLLGQGAQGQAGTLDRIRHASQTKVGYHIDARPFSYRGESGQPTGYAVALCQEVVSAVQREPGLAGTATTWIPVTDGRALEQGQVDLLCGPETVTLTKRATISFSIPIFPGGTGVLVRADAPARLQEVLSGRGQTFRPTWRASALQVLQSRAFSAVDGTASGRWLTERVRDLQVIADVSLASDYDKAVQALLDRRSDALFGERAVLLDTARNQPAGRLRVLPHQFTYEPIGLAFERGDEEFRLLVDRALSRLYSSGAIGGLYTKWFGEPDEMTLAFFRWNTLLD